MATRLTQRIYLGFGVMLLILLLLAGFAYYGFSRLALANERNLHTHQVLQEAQALKTAVVSMQTGYRGYMLAGDREFLEPLERGIPLFERHLSRMVELTAGNPRQQSLLARVGRLQREWRRIHIDSGLAARNRIPDDAVDLQELLRMANTERGRRFVEGITTRIDEVAAIEAGLQASRAARVERLEGVTGTLLGAGGLFAILITAVFARLAARSSESLLGANRRLEREIQERRRAEGELERVSRRHALILHAAGEGIYGLDRAGNTSFANPAALRMTGYSAEELLGRPNHAMVHHSRPDGSPYPHESCPIQSSLRDGLVHAVDSEVFWRKDGTSFPVEYIATPIWDDGEITGAVVTFADITERREVERMKDEFVSVVSHELRTPLTSIRGSLGLLASGRLGELPERGQRLLEIATQNTDRLVRLINDILDIERVESGRGAMERSACDAGALMRQAVEVVQEVAERAGVGLVLEPVRAPVWADPDRIVQVMTNLLSNAVKFSSAGDAVRFRAETLPGAVRFEVRDEGRGIPADKLETIFGRFQQVDASDSREKGGTGLGLAIARTIVRQHGGEIRVESTLGEGSAFFFTVPLARPPEAAERRPAAAGRALVLLCDDDASVRAIVGEQLEQQGYRVLLAASGPEAVELAAAHRPDAVLLDLMMPGMDGWETMERLKEREETRELPILIFSAAPQEAGKAERAGAAGWVGKGGEEASLFGALERALSRSSAVGRILLVEDDLDLAEVLLAMFERNGLSGALADSCEEAVRLAGAESFDLVVLDLVLREGSGFDVVDCLRRHDRLRLAPLVVYSAMDVGDADRERLRLGRTEFFTKGRITPEEFERRVLAILEEMVAAHGADEPTNPDR